MNDQLPPHSPEDERGVIACCIEDSDLCLPDCAKLTEGYFYDERHKILWRAISELSGANQSVDQISVHRWLSQHDQKQLANEYLTDVLNSIPTALNLSAYLPHLTDCAIKRKMIRGCSQISKLAMNGTTANDLMARAETLLSFERPDTVSVMNGDSAGIKMIDDLERRHQLQGVLPGLDTGLTGLNEMLDGLQYGEQTLVGARPSQGKTAIGLGIFEHVTMTLKMPALFVSIEMSAASLMRRMLSSHTGIKMGVIRRGTYTDGDFKKFKNFRIAAMDSPMHILDGVGGIGISELCVIVRRHVRQHKTKLVVIDYLQKIKPSERHEKRTYEIGDISGRLKALAVDSGAAFLTLAQINRESEKNKGKVSGIPRLSDLAESGQIERDADTVILINRDKSDPTGKAQLIVAKQRDGQTGAIEVKFNGSLCRFENQPIIDRNDIPEQRKPYHE